jgi:hypothetical protein
VKACLLGLPLVANPRQHRCGLINRHTSLAARFNPRNRGFD